MGNKAVANQRKTLIVDGSFQTPFITKFFLMVAVASLVMGALVYAFSTQTVTTIFKDSRLKIVTTADFILPWLLISMAVIIAVVGFATALIALYTSHRIAGPIYRLRKDLASFKAGGMGQIFRVRDTDEIKMLAVELDDMARGLEKSFKELKNEISGLEAAAGELPPGARGRVESLKRILENYRA